MIFHDVDQNSDEWFQLRAGKLTGSGFSKIMANYGKAFGDPAKKYATAIAVERLTGKPIGSSYSNEHMERGHQQEPLARMAYEQENFCTVANGGFFDHGDVGVSPDGLVGSEGVIEIKSVISSVHFNNVKRQSYDPTYKWQLIGNLKFTGREWIDFISFCDEFPYAQKLYEFRLYAEDLQEQFAMLDKRIGDFFKLVETIKQQIINSNYHLLRQA